MSRKKTNYKMKTFEKLKMLGIENDKDILNLKIEDLVKLPELQLRDVLNIIELRNSIRTKGLVGYLLDIQKE
jgi:hypothetical protein